MVRAIESDHQCHDNEYYQGNLEQAPEELANTYFLDNEHKAQESEEDDDFGAMGTQQRDQLTHLNEPPVG